VAPLAFALLATTSTAQILDTHLWGTNGPVKAVARAGNTIYLGGWFSIVGPCTGGGAAVDDASGARLERFPHVAGSVRAAVPDGSGGWFIGGSFSAVEGVARANLAHLLADGSVSAWDPGASSVDPFEISKGPARIDVVNALVLQGRTLYAGGTLTTVGGQRRNHIAAIDAISGAVTSWNPDADRVVAALALKGGLLYAGGGFERIGGQPRARIAALDLKSGASTAWDPRADNRVLALAIQGRTLYAGGEFDAIGGQPRNSIAALDLDTGLASEWDAYLGPRRYYIAHGDWVWPYVATLAVRGRTIYAGGWFTTAAAVSRVAVAALDAESGAVTPWDARIETGTVEAIALGERSLYMGGYFARVGGETRLNLAAVDSETGVPGAWNPRANASAASVSTGGSMVFVGGGFTSLGNWKERLGMAALDATTGAATDWDPKLDGTVEAFARFGNILYVAGSFSHMDGRPRQRLAAIDADTGALTDWAPGANQDVTALALADSTLYAGGRFSVIGGLPRQSLAAFDAATGTMRPWSPALHYPYTGVDAMAVDRQELFVGGGLYAWNSDFMRTQLNLAGFDPATARWTAWNPDPGPHGSVQIAALQVDGDRVYVGGNFANMGGQSRRGIAAVDTAGGAVQPWAPDPDGPWNNYAYLVAAIAARGKTVYVGGTFRTIGGKDRYGLAALDAVSGAALDWDPQALGNPHYSAYPDVGALIVDGNTLYAGGGFNIVSGFPRSGFAAFALGPVVSRESVNPMPVMEARHEEGVRLEVTSPVRSSGVIRFHLPKRAATTVLVFDLQGRRVANVLDGEVATAGEHALGFETRDWVPGVYLFRLSVGGASVTRKILVMR
jgi:hypothetical protein